MVLELGSKEITTTTGLQMSQQNTELLSEQSISRLHMIILLYDRLQESQF